MHLFFKNTHQIIILLGTLLLTACSASPVSIQLQPELSQDQKIPPMTHQVAWQIGSQDHRVAQYLIEVTKGEGVATLINGSQSSRLMIENTLQKKWQQYGMTFDKQSNKKLNIQLIELLAKVKQNSISHEVDANIIIKVELQTQKQRFSKVFRSHATRKAPLSVNIEKTGQQLNEQLSQLLDEILQDPELNAKLQQL